MKKTIDPQKREWAMEELTRVLKPGTKVTTVLKHMNQTARRYSVLVVDPDDNKIYCLDQQLLHIGYTWIDARSTPNGISTSGDGDTLVASLSSKILGDSTLLKNHTIF